MTRSLRTATVALAAATIGLALTSSALGALNPKFVVTHTPQSPAATTTTLKIALDPNDDAVLRFAFYAPSGISATLTQAAGTQIGTVATHIIAKAVSPTAILPVNGTIVTDDPSKYTTNPATFGCTGTFTHQAVWLLNLSAAGRQLAVPAYVDPTAGPESAAGAYKIIACLPSPDIPESQGGAALGAKVVDAALTYTNVFTLGGAGQYVWPAYVTPYAAGTATPNPAGTKQALAVDRVPGAVSISAKKAKAKKGAKTKRYTVRGTVTENGTGVSGARVDLFMGAKALKRVARMTTGASGAYAKAVAIRTKTKVQARVAVPERDLGTAGCSLGASLPPAPAGCAGATAGSFTAASRTLTLR